MSHRDAYILLSLVALLWAGNFPASKIGLAELGPITLTTARAVLVTPVLLLLARFLQGPLPTLRRSDYKTFIVLSLTGLVCNTTIWFWGMQYTSPINAGILGAAAPAVVAVIGALWLGDRLSGPNMAGIGLTVAAVLLTISHGSIETLRTSSFNRGDLLILTSEIGWVTYALYSRATTTQLAPVTIMAGAHVVSSVLLLPLALAVEGWTPLARAGWPGWGVVLYGAFPVTLGHLWFYQCIRTVGGGSGDGLHQPHPVPGDRALVGDPRRAHPLVPRRRRHGGDRRRRPDDPPLILEPGKDAPSSSTGYTSGGYAPGDRRAVVIGLPGHGAAPWPTVLGTQVHLRGFGLASPRNSTFMAEEAPHATKREPGRTRT